jgi:hypothetical protein
MKTVAPEMIRTLNGAVAVGVRQSCGRERGRRGSRQSLACRARSGSRIRGSARWRGLIRLYDAARHSIDECFGCSRELACA